jgi:hypothetical protein
MSDKEKLISLLQNRELDILHVKEIYYNNRQDREIVSQVAMNLSLKTSVYNRKKAYSQTMIELLCDIAENRVDMSARWAVAKNPHTPQEVLVKLSKDEVNLVRALVATNHSTPPEILQRLFNDEKIVRDGLSANPSTPKKILKLFVHDEDRLVRIRLAQNSATDKETLQLLLKDSDRDVSLAAKDTLES